MTRGMVSSSDKCVNVQWSLLLIVDGTFHKMICHVIQRHYSSFSVTLHFWLLCDSERCVFFCCRQYRVLLLAVIYLLMTNQSC